MGWAGSTEHPLEGRIKSGKWGKLQQWPEQLLQFQ